MEKVNISFNKSDFPNVVASYGESAGEVICELARYLKEPDSENKFNRILNDLECDLKSEKNSVDNSDTCVNF